MVLSFVVGYIVSEVVRKCGCNIVEGVTGNPIDDPMKPDVKPTDIYGNPKCTSENVPKRINCPNGSWKPYYSPGASGVDGMPCRYKCIVPRVVDNDGTVISTPEEGDVLGIYYACTEKDQAIPFEEWNSGGCKKSDSS